MFAAWLRPENKQQHRKSHRRHVRLSPTGTITKPHDTFFGNSSAAPLPRRYLVTKTQVAVTGGCELLACLHSLSLACCCFTCSFPVSSTTHSLNAIPNSYTLISTPLTILRGIYQSAQHQVGNAAVISTWIVQAALTRSAIVTGLPVTMEGVEGVEGAPTLTPQIIQAVQHRRIEASLS
jgi:hypothetical protein